MDQCFAGSSVAGCSAVGRLAADFVAGSQTECSSVAAGVQLAESSAVDFATGW